MEQASTETKDNSAELCEYCLAINFKALRHPTAANIIALEEGGSPPMKINSREDKGYWSLGLQSRINTSSLSCRLCYAVCELVRQQPRVKRHWEVNSWTDPLCLASIEAVGTLTPRKGSFWKTVKSFLPLARISLHWRERDGEAHLRPGRCPDGSFVFQETNCVYLHDALQVSSAESSDVSVDCLFTNDSLSSDRLCGARKRPELIDLHLPARWLKECIASHSDTCCVSTMADATAIRLIDVRSKTLVEFSQVNLSKLTYVTVSYVWGGPPPVSLTKRSLPNFLQSRSLAKGLPQTIEDALSFTAAMGSHYLWVDALCIVQDDEDDKAVQIGQMSAIYSQALFVIVAAEGQNVHAGLPGIEIPRAASQMEVPLPRKDGEPQTSILTGLTPRSHTSNTAYSDTLWATRGWTFQEHVLSPRAFIFMEHQLLWECKACSWAEDSYLEFNIAKASWQADVYLPWRRSWEDKVGLWQAIFNLFQDYQYRDLTFAGDAHDAVGAILSGVESSSGEKFIWGMPVSQFNAAMCLWPPKDAAPIRRTSLTTRRLTSLKRQVPFPSWTWLGWDKQYARFDFDTDYTRYTAYNEYFIFKNNPVRLEPVGVHDPSSKSLTLDDIISSSSHLPLSRLQNFPDDQYLCFWGQLLSFSSLETVQVDDAKDVPTGTTFFTSENASFLISELIPFANDYREGRFYTECRPEKVLPLPERWHRVLIDKESHRKVGETGTCGLERDEGRSRAPILLYLTRVKGGRTYSKDKVMALEVVEEEGVHHRANIVCFTDPESFILRDRSDVIVLG